LDGGSLVQLTDIRTGGSGGSDATPPQNTESQEFIKKEERELIEALRGRTINREELEAKRKPREKRKPFSPPSGQSVSNLNPSPDGKYVVATILGQSTGAKAAIVPNFVTDSAYTEDIQSRSKVGDIQSMSRMVILNAETGEAKWVEHGVK